MEEENVKTIAEYIEVLNRRKGLIFISFLTVGFLGFVLAMKLPPVYRSAATILIEDQQIPQSMVQTTITDFADKRIELIKQRVMTRDRILSIIEKHKIYLEEREKLVPSELVKLFMDDAEIKTIAADVFDPQSRGKKATIAFTIAFSNRNPKLAQAVANELVSLFLDENTRTRAQRAAKTTEFMAEEANKLKAEIAGFESQLVEYKEKNAKSLPEMLQANLAAIDRAKESLRQIDSDIRIAKDRIVYLNDALRQGQDEIPTMQAGKPLSKDEQIRVLKSEYIRLSSRYTARHPDAIRVKRQIQNLDPSFTGDSGAVELREELEQAEKELALLKDKYSDTHPDVIKQLSTVDKLAQQLDVATKNTASDEEANGGGSQNVNLTGQLRSTEHELEHLQKVKQDVQNSIAQTQESIDRTPLVEKEYQELIRLRQISLAKYGELEVKHREAKLAQTLEEEQKGEAFTLIDPPVAPDKPDKPNRKKIIMMGLAGGLAVGFGLTIVLEMLNDAIRGAKALERVTGTPPIVVIPFIETLHDIEIRKRRKKTFWLASLIVVVVLIVATHFLVMPLGVVWAGFIAKLGRL